MPTGAKKGGHPTPRPNVHCYILHICRKGKATSCICGKGEALKAVQMKHLARTCMPPKTSVLCGESSCKLYKFSCSVLHRACMH